MRVRVHSLLANPQRVVRPDTVVDLPTAEAQTLVAAGYATEQREPEPQPEAEPEPQPEPESGEFPRHKGAGWFELSDGSTVRGEEDAQAAEAELRG